MSPYRIVFGNPSHLRFYLEYKAMWAIKKLICDFQATKEKRLLHMNELDELRNKQMTMPGFTRKILRNDMIREF